MKLPAVLLKKILIVFGALCVVVLVFLLVVSLSFTPKEEIVESSLAQQPKPYLPEQVNLRQYTLPLSRDQLSDLEKFDIHVCLMAPYEKDCDYVLADENIAIFKDPILEQCSMMPGMPACERYTDG